MILLHGEIPGKIFPVFLRKEAGGELIVRKIVKEQARGFSRTGRLSDVYCILFLKR